ncbi:MAG: hypothetical protein PHP85_04920 [Gallionella sp.]|nr:hypothetical protein [Gallionella sp.]
MNKFCLIVASLLLFCSTAGASTIGTVFYSPAERGALVAARNGISQSTVYTLSGIIQRGAGKSAAWINGRAVTQVPPDPVIPSLVIGRDHVKIEDKILKVGESIDINSGQRILRLPEKSVRVKP